MRTLSEMAESMRICRLHDRMGLELIQAEPTLILEMPITEEVGGAMPGTIHGGMLATLADVASALALEAHYEAFVQIPVTTDMHIRYYRQPKAGPIRAEAHVEHAGRRLLSAECAITDADGRQLARSTGTYMLVDFSA